MKLRYRLVVVSTVGLFLTVTIFAAIGYYLMGQYPVLGWAAGNNPFEALNVARQMMVNDVSEDTPVKTFNTSTIDRNYSQTVEFPEDKFELATAEQIIEWSVRSNSQPWVDDVDTFLSLVNFSIRDTTVHFVFIECQSGNNPVMTLTYYVSNQSMLVTKGWVDKTTVSYTCYTTENLALEVITFNSDYLLLLKAVMENLNRNILVL